MHNLSPHRPWVLAVLWIALLPRPGFAADAFSPLETLLDQGQHTQAWQAAQPLRDAHEGNPRFDYLFGLAALENGHYDLALFALERAAANAPGVLRPQLELARTYMLLKNTVAAKQAFESVLALKPPEPVRQKVQAYLQQLQAPATVATKAASNSSVSGMLSLAAGYDSNANLGAGEASITTPVFGTVLLDPSSVKQDSPFVEARAALNYRYLPAGEATWFAGLSAGRKQFTDVDGFDTNDLQIEAGTQFVEGQRRYHLAARELLVQLDDADFSRTTGLDMGVEQALEGGSVLAVQAALEKHRNLQQPLQDNRRQQVAGQYRFKTGDTGHQFELLAGHEIPRQLAGKHFSRDILGGGYTAVQRWGDGQSSSLGISFQQRKHQADDPVYGQPRKDHRLVLQLGHQVVLDKQTSLFANGSYLRNNSNLDLYTSRKGSVQLGLRYQF